MGREGNGKGEVGREGKWKIGGREREEGREGRGRGKGSAGGAFPQIKIYDYTPGGATRG